jgi:hypothetical protein
MEHGRSQSDDTPVSDDTLCACTHFLHKHRVTVVVREAWVRVILLCGECAAAGKRRSPLQPRFRVNRCLLPALE